MKRTITILYLALALTVAAFAQAAPAQQPKPEHRSKQQLNTLIAPAKTPAASAHRSVLRGKGPGLPGPGSGTEAMVAAYEANSSLSNEKNRASTIGHCEYFVKTFKDLAIKSQELATLHEQMAKDVEQK